MINIDTVYQRVLALANKEQRGYITPQEFNLFANQAQMEILEQYFYDISQYGNLQGNSTEYSDMVGLIDEKLNELRIAESFTAVNSKIALSTTIPALYKLGSVYLGNNEVEEVNYNEYKLRNKSPLTQPDVTMENYMYVVQASWPSYLTEITIFPNIGTSPVEISYIKKPRTVKWGYVVISEKALYNSGTSTNFQLHSSEENELIYKILGYAGITLKKSDVIQSAGALEIAKVQQEKQG